MINENKTRGDDRLRQASLALGKAMEENRLLREACREAFLYMTCPKGSARDTPINRGNLSRMLEKALIAAGEKL